MGAEVTETWESKTKVEYCISQAHQIKKGFRGCLAKVRRAGGGGGGVRALGKPLRRGGGWTAG